MITIKLMHAQNFAKAAQAVRAREFDKARELVKGNPESDKRIIERRIEEAKNAYAKRNMTHE